MQNVYHARTAMLTLIKDNSSFPPVTQALRDPNGLLAIGGDLTPERLLDAYRHGIFPWFNEDDPILWWSPDPRMVLFPREFKLSRSLRKTLKKGEFELRTDHAFEDVMRACAAPRPGQSGTWIHEDMVAAYTTLHRMGYAHSVEVWMPKINSLCQPQGEAETRRQRVADELELAGGLYGIAIGRMFYGESMFSRRSDASKIALAHLTAQLARWNFGMIDCQMNTAHLASLGAREIPREDFMQRLQELVNYDNRESPWEFEHDIIA
jgi:leucyl/phenylalanyl-tRNA--protein transferase